MAKQVRLNDAAPDGDQDKATAPQVTCNFGDGLCDKAPQASSGLCTQQAVKAHNAFDKKVSPIVDMFYKF